VTLSQAQREALLWTVVAGATCAPWVLGWSVHWWVGLVALGLFLWLYDRMFVPPGAMCMGIPFMVPLAGGLAYLGWGILLLAVWLRGLVV
jgi:hypothetical protein